MLLRITDDEPDFASNIYGTAGQTWVYRNIL